MIWFIELFILRGTTIYIQHILCMYLCSHKNFAMNTLQFDIGIDKDVEGARDLTTLLLVSFIHSFYFQQRWWWWWWWCFCVCVFFCCCWFCLFYILLKHHWIRYNRHHSFIFQEMIINLFESWPAEYLTLYARIDYKEYTCTYACVIVFVMRIICYVVFCPTLYIHKLFSISTFTAENFPNIASFIILRL